MYCVPPEPDGGLHDLRHAAGVAPIRSGAVVWNATIPPVVLLAGAREAPLAGAPPRVSEISCVLITSCCGRVWCLRLGR